MPHRVFYIFDTKGDIVRGRHANKDSEFVMFCIRGSCKVRVDNGKFKSEVALNTQNGAPQNALWLDKMVWKEMFDFSNDAVCGGAVVVAVAGIVITVSVMLVR